MPLHPVQAESHKKGTIPPEATSAIPSGGEAELPGCRTCLASAKKDRCASGQALRLSAVQVLARDVAYELIPFSQRRSLHAQLARALEDDVSAGLVPPGIVAYHWTHSCAGAEATHWRRALHVCIGLQQNPSLGGICGLAANIYFLGYSVWHVHMICLLNVMAAVFQGALLLYQLSLLAIMSLEQAVM